LVILFLLIKIQKLPGQNKKSAKKDVFFSAFINKAGWSGEE
jgi:hypothetical protein